MHYHPNKNDLRKLKDSKPVPITAHTHEVIVPVVYSGLVNTFLKKKSHEDYKFRNSGFIIFDFHDQFYGSG